MAFRREMIQSKLVFITGATGVLGSALMNCFWKSGWSLALSARDEHKLKALIDKLEKRVGQSLFIFPCDLSDPIQVNKVALNAISILPRIDALVNTAAIHGPIGPFIENDQSLWHKAMQVNFLSPIALCKFFGELMKEKGHGSIVNISGGGGAGNRPNFSSYACAKTALIRFSEIFSSELLSSGVRVNCVAPGLMKSKMLLEATDNKSSLTPKEISAAMEVIASNENSLYEVEKLVLFLAGDESAEISGKLISAVWDRWDVWPSYAAELKETDLYTLRRITAKDRGFEWGDL